MQEEYFYPTYVGGWWGAPGPQSRNFDLKKGICPQSRWMYKIAVGYTPKAVGYTQKAVGYTQKAAGYTQNRAVEAHPHPLSQVGGCSESPIQKRVIGAGKNTYLFPLGRSEFFLNRFLSFLMELIFFCTTVWGHRVPSGPRNFFSNPSENSKIVFKKLGFDLTEPTRETAQNPYSSYINDPVR